MSTTSQENQSLLLPKRIVGIGASAGGLEAIESLFRALPTDLGLAYVIVQHLSPDFRSLMDELLARFTRMPVVVLGDETTVEKDHIYILPPKRDVVAIGNKLVTSEKPPTKLTSLIIDKFFESLAKSWGSRAVGVILSGTGVDGTVGSSSIMEANGLVIAQDPEEARFDGMPMSVIASGCIHRVCPAAEIPSELIGLMAEPPSDLPSAGDAVKLGQLISEPAARDLFELLRESFGLDFEQYKPSTIFRRVQRRVALRDPHHSLSGYLNIIKDDDDELEALYKDLLIGVTGFFRDREAFDLLRESVIKKDLADLPPEQEYRVWACGCATGEEAYSLAMEILEEFEAIDRPPSLKIFASDLNKDSLDIASEGIYNSTALLEVPPELREKYFTSLGSDQFRVAPALRKTIIFSEHNLLRSPPFTRINLISCRNLLIYLRQEAQSTVLSSFNFSLVNNGTLFLGNSETLGSHSEDFEVVDRNFRIFRKIREGRLTIPAKRAENSRQLMSVDYNRQKNDSRYFMGRVYQTLLDKHIHAGLLISESGELIEPFGHNQEIIQQERSIQSENNGLMLIIPTDLRTKVSEAMAKLIAGSSQVDQLEFEWDQTKVKHPRKHRVSIRRFHDKVLGASYYMVAIQPVLQAKPVEHVFRNSKEFSLTVESQRYIEELKTELVKTKESLQTNAEELETSNEELQASNEELQASNEELQSTNEELHSVNEELFTVNSELEHKITELDRTSIDLRNLVDSTLIGTVFLDQDFKIRIFTPRITGVFSLVQSDVGRDLRSFTPKIEDADLIQDISRAYENRNTFEKVLISENSTTPIYIRRVAPYEGSGGKIEGVLISYVEIDSQMINPRLKIINRFSKFFT